MFALTCTSLDHVSTHLYHRKHAPICYKIYHFSTHTHGVAMSTHIHIIVNHSRTNRIAGNFGGCTFWGIKYKNIFGDINFGKFEY